MGTVNLTGVKSKTGMIGVVFRIAARNISLNRRKTLIVGSLILAGMAVLVIGNSMIETSIRGIRSFFIESFSGHIMISGSDEGSLSLIGYQEPDFALNEPVPTLPRIDRLIEHTTGYSEVESVTPQITGRAFVNPPGISKVLALFFGVDVESYRAMFPDNLEIVSGRFLEPGEEGVVLSKLTVSEIREAGGVDVGVGERVLLTSIPGPTGTRVREVPVVGIFRFRHSGGMVDRVSFLDAENMRALLSMRTGSFPEVTLDEEETALLAMESTDGLFRGSMIEETADTERRETGDEVIILESRSESSPIAGETESDSWHFLLVRLKSDSSVSSVRDSLNLFFEEEGLTASASGWLRSAGFMGTLTYTVKRIFNLFVILIFLVAVIIIANILVISVTERSAEIGTMRAMGAQRTFILGMVTLETLIVTGIFGLSGIVLGTGILFVLRCTGIAAPNIIFEVLFGGGTLKPALTAGSLVLSLTVVAAMALLASLYPAFLAVRVPPVRAME